MPNTHFITLNDSIASLSFHRFQLWENIFYNFLYTQIIRNDSKQLQIVCSNINYRYVAISRSQKQEARDNVYPLMFLLNLLQVMT